MRLYKYLYYRLYSWNLKTWGEKDVPQWNALIGVTFMMVLNLYVFRALLLFVDIEGVRDLEVSKPFLVILALIIGYINYRRFIQNERYKEFSVEYKNESRYERRKNAVLLWVYAIGSFALVFGLSALAGKLEGNW